MIKINNRYGIVVNKWSYDLVNFTKDKDGKESVDEISKLRGEMNELVNNLKV